MHAKDMKQPNDPKSDFKVGDAVRVKVLSTNPAKGYAMCATSDVPQPGKKK